MTSIHEIFTTFGPEYLQRYATTMPRGHRKVIDAITQCRTEACGMAFYQCDSCAEPSQFFRSCGNRHCPTCQYNKTQQWLQKQITRQLPGHHFLITFTVPEQLRPFMRQHQRACYSALFKASSEAIKKLALDRKHIGGDLPGYYGFMNPNCKITLERIRGLIELSYGFAVDLPLPEVEPRRQTTCPNCGGLLKLFSVAPPLKILRRSG